MRFSNHWKGSSFRQRVVLLAFGVLALPCVALAQQVEQENEDDQQQQAAETTDAVELEEAPVQPATELEEAPVQPATKIEEVVVTGSRLQRTPGELAGNLMVLDENFIRATGEVTLERVLRQLPQNANPTQERFGSNLNTANNLTGASTVNLRGLGSESTLILVDGKRLGHSGILGGVSDVSSIPLSIVERIEVLLDGASAVYGSDAVGGVVNIITRKDYKGLEINLNYNWPSEAGFDELQGTLSGGFSMGADTRIRASVQRTDHSGMDASDRNATLLQQSEFSGPQFDLRFCCLADGSALPIFYRLDGDVLTFPQYFALSPEDKERAMPETHAILPVGFNENSSVDEITEFRVPNWGAETQRGFSVLPESVRDTFTINLEQDFGELLSAELSVRYQNRETLYRRGYVAFSGSGWTFGSANPYNPFGRNVHIRGQRRDMPQPSLETESENLDLRLDFEGAFGDSGWEWQAGVARSTTESDTLRLNSLNGEAVRAGLAYRSRTERRYDLTEEDCLAMGGRWNTFFGVYCIFTYPPPDAINPFGDLTPYLDRLTAGSTNEQTNLEAMLRGDLFALPAGDVRLLLGYAYNELVLETASEFQVVTFNSPTGQVDSFNTDADRKNQAAFFETLVPVIGSANARPGLEKLSLSLSGRWDSYDEPSVVFNEEDGGAIPAENLSDPGAEFTWGIGINYQPVSDIRLRVNRQTAFVAPQLNQVIVATGIGPSQPFRGLFLQQPDGNLRQVQIRVIEGGNSELDAETADTLSYGFEIAPRFVPGLSVKATWSETEYKDRINRLSNFTVDPNDLPSGTYYIPEEDLYVQERRWINVSSIDREGVDYEIYYERPSALGVFSAQLRHSRTTAYEYVVDPLSGEDPVSVLSHTRGSTTVGVVPRSSTNAQLIWGYRGLEIGLDISLVDETSRTLSSITNTYTPPELLDLTLSYNFGAGGLLPTPAMLDGARLVFTVNNLSDDYGKTEVFRDDGAVLDQSSPDASPLYGRVFNLSFHMSIGTQ